MSRDWRTITPTSEDMRAMRADADDVLQDCLVIRRAARPVAVVLQAEAAELAGVVFEHRAGAPRRRPAAVDRAGGKQPGLPVAVDLVITQPYPPARHEPVDR